MFKNLGTIEILAIAAIIFLLFGGKKIPELAKGLGLAAREFKKGLSDTSKPAKKITKN